MENLKLKQKAYKIDLNQIEDGFLSNETIVHSDTIGKAKTLLLRKNSYEGFTLKDIMEPISFLNIPIIRCPEADLYEFEGKVIPMYKVKEITEERGRIEILDGFLINDSIKYCYIRKGAYYRPNSNGYTDFTTRAGIYTKEDAVSRAKSCRDLSIIPVDIEVHNKMINAEISDLQTRLLN